MKTVACVSLATKSFSVAAVINQVTDGLFFVLSRISVVFPARLLPVTTVIRDGPCAAPLKAVSSASSSRFLPMKCMGFLVSNNNCYDNDGYYNGSFLDLTTVMSGNATLFVRLLVKLFGQSQ